MTIHAGAQDASPVTLAAARAEFDTDVTYLVTATFGLPRRRSWAALQQALAQWRAGTADAVDYDLPLAAARASYAHLAGVDPSVVAVGSQVSVFAGLIAANLPDDSDVLTAIGDFTSILFPFYAQSGRGIRVREVPLDRMAECVTSRTTLVAVSAVQSADTKLIVTTGLVATAAFYAWVAATTSTTTSYGIIAAQMVLFGLGMGLTSAPATESIMGAISRAKAGVGSAVNDSTRLVGGTLGVAVIGSAYASVYASRLTATMPAHIPGSIVSIAHQSVGAAYAAADQIAALGHPVLGQALQHAAASAFLRGLTVSCLVACVVAGAGALLAALFLPAQPPRPAHREALQVAATTGAAAKRLGDQ